jgi:hypothetical protein
MTLPIKRYAVKIKLVEDLLGTVPKNKEVYATFIAQKGRELIEKQAAKKGVPLASGAMPEGHPQPEGQQPVAPPADLDKHLGEEVESIEEVEERGWTGFHTDAEGPFLFDYAVKGYLCEAARTLGPSGKALRGVRQVMDKVKRYCFVKPRRVRLPTPGKVETFDQADKPMLVLTPQGAVLERPLRAMTAQGPRVTVTRSDVILAGAEVEFELWALDGGGLSKALLEDILSYGQFMGLGQWRSGGWGRFEIIDLAKLGGDDDDDDADDDSQSAPARKPYVGKLARSARRRTQGA